uniref:Syndecan n=1 Tax=Crocodylus porosus TaxID=8502 RepID=A0A7M4E398_CROPO
MWAVGVEGKVAGLRGGGDSFTGCGSCQSAPQRRLQRELRAQAGRPLATPLARTRAPRRRGREHQPGGRAERETPPPPSSPREANSALELVGFLQPTSEERRRQRRPRAGGSRAEPSRAEASAAREPPLLGRGIWSGRSRRGALGAGLCFLLLFFLPRLKQPLPRPQPGNNAERVDPAPPRLGGLRVLGGGAEDEDSTVMTTSRTLPKITTSDAPKAETTTLKTQTKIPAQTKSPEEIDKEKMPETKSKTKDELSDDTDVFTEKHSENLFQRTEVLAAVIAGGVIGFLFAIFLILLLVYRMRKKDEGSYDLGEHLGKYCWDPKTKKSLLMRLLLGTVLQK